MTTIHKLKASTNGCTFEVKVKDTGDITIKTKDGFTLPEESILMKIKDNGNGYSVKTKSYYVAYPEHWFNLDYAEIEYLYYAYKALLESKEKMSCQN